MNMHPGELTLTREMIVDLIAAYLPEYKDLPLSETDFGGTVNHVYRLGADMYLRLPRMPHNTDLVRESEWLEFIQPHVDVKLPRPLRLLNSPDAYPSVWGVFDWIQGDTLMQTAPADEANLAIELSQFVKQLHRLPVPENAPAAGRLPLKQLDQKTREAIAACSGMFEEVNAEQMMLSIWANALQAETWNGDRCFIHADLLKTNIMQKEGKLWAILDFGGFGAGDPAFDLIPAWAVFGPAARKIYRSQFDYDENVWLRAKAYALHQAVLIIPYYAESYPEFTAMAKNTVRQIIIDS